MTIDAVITWVDGDDPRHRAKRAQHGGQELHENEDIAGSTRFSNLGEIYYCIASLNRFAPWLHKIYIVTDEQDPCVGAFLAEHFPNGHIPVEVVDHKVIFRGYEQYLPTFNSIAIETMTWRIPGLSEHYIEFNDDLLLAAPVDPTDFFLPDGSSVCYATRCSMLWTKLTRMLKAQKNGQKRVTFKGSMYNAAVIANRRCSYLKLAHTPKALRKSVYENYFSLHLDHMLKNIEHRFRHSEQFTSQELQYLLLEAEGRVQIRPVDANLFFLQPKGRRGYVEKKMERLQQMKGCKFCCFNSLDKATIEERAQIIGWINERIGL
jgi:hypothetical protein